MVVRDAMHGITKVSSTTSVEKAAKLMDTKVIGSVLVEEDNKIIGIMTERDILRKVVAQGIDFKKLNVKEIMSSQIITIDADMYVEDAASLLEKHKVRRLIVTQHENIIGIVTARDIAEKSKYFMAKRIVKGSLYGTRLGDVFL
jgi:signal-transduction protein with cAMP-binding, CBS, and nucleotidyltransferase domain